MTTGYVLTDIFGTTTPMDHSADVKSLLKTPEMKNRIESNPSYRGQSVEDIVAKGEGEAKAGRKDNGLNGKNNPFNKSTHGTSSAINGDEAESRNLSGRKPS